MKYVTLDVTDHVDDNGQLNVDTLCEWLDSLHVLVGHETTHNDRIMLSFTGERNDLIKLITRYATNDRKKIKTLVGTIRD